MQYFRLIFESLLICPLFYNYPGNAIHLMLFNLISNPRVPSLPTYPWCWWWLERRRAVVRFVSVSVSDHLPLDICCGNTEQYTIYNTLHTPDTAALDQDQGNVGVWVWAGSRVELQMNLREDWSFTITENAPTRAFSWLKVPSSAFTFKTLLGQ